MDLTFYQAVEECLRAGAQDLARGRGTFEKEIDIKGFDIGENVFWP